MPNLMDNSNYQSVPFKQNNSVSFIQLFNNACQNPRAFEEDFRRNNPQAYDRALRIRNSANPQAMIMNMVRQSGLNFETLHRLGLM